MIRLHLDRLLCVLTLLFWSQSGFAESNPSLGQSAYFSESELDEQAPLSEELDAELSFSLSGRRYDDAVINSRWGRAAVGLDLKKNFSSYLSGRFAIEQRFTSGASSNYYAVTEGSSGPQATLIDEAALTFKPSDYFQVAGGLLSTELSPIYSMMTSQSWFAARVQSDIKMDDNKILFAVSQATPSAGGVSNRTSDESTLPLFTQGTVLGELNPLETLKLRASYTSFVFTDPSSRTAEDSRYSGSTVLGNGPYIFAYDYKGSEIAASAKLTLLLDDELQLKAAQIRNDKAPNKLNTGSSWRAEYKKKFNRYELTGALTGFRTEPDSLPSTYAIESQGFTNRIGHSVSFKVKVPRQNISIVGIYTNADVLNKNVAAAGTQADREVYAIKTELTYDIF